MIGEYKYVLDGRTPALEQDTERWAIWFETADRQVALTEIGQSQVSTVFLGLDQNFGRGPGLPVLFETLVSGGQMDDSTRRYLTWDEAVLGHAEIVTMVEEKGEKA